MCGLLTVSGQVAHDDLKIAALPIEYRGPDDTEIMIIGDKGGVAFHRLAIMDLSHHGDQPFISPSRRTTLVCNGEIYNYKKIKSDYKNQYAFHSGSDCEVLIPLYEDHGLEKLCRVVDAEFALVLYDAVEDKWKAARDPIGIRPLFYGQRANTGDICFASEVKALKNFCDVVKPFPPGHYYDGEKFISYLKVENAPVRYGMTEEEALKGIRKYLTEATVKRLQSDAPLGFLLSGGLDSSLVCAIAAREGVKLTTFAVGMNENPIDIKYAKIVADYLGTNHHEVYFTKKDIFETVEKLIYHLETFDITTIRASIGMSLVCHYVRNKTNLKVVLTGEVSDELFGYKYTDFAPNPEEFQKEAQKRIRELYMYDVLRADRCISSNSLEARVPFSDRDFVEFVMSIPPELKMNTRQMGKYLLRAAFAKDDYLPPEILWREKAAFSDAVGHSMVDYLKEYAEEKYSADDLLKAQKKFKHCPPITKEALWYREIFEEHYGLFAKDLITDFWMPNKSWPNCNVNDPSARVLKNYGASGN